MILKKIKNLIQKKINVSNITANWFRLFTKNQWLKRIGVYDC